MQAEERDEGFGLIQQIQLLVRNGLITDPRSRADARRSADQVRDLVAIAVLRGRCGPRAEVHGDAAHVREPIRAEEAHLRVELAHRRGEDVSDHRAVVRARRRAVRQPVAIRDEDVEELLGRRGVARDHRRTGPHSRSHA